MKLYLDKLYFFKRIKKTEDNMKILNIPFLTFFSFIFSLISILIAIIWGILFKTGGNDE